MKCIGCGIKLQNVDSKLLGYVRSDVMTDMGEETYCERCYQIIHHGLKYEPTITNKDYYNKIDVIKDKKAIVVLVVDVLNLFTSFIPKLSVHIGDNPVIIVVNKIDVIPKDIHLKRIEEVVQSIADKEKINIRNICLISAKKETNVEQVMKKIIRIKEEYFYKKRFKITDTYVLGCASTGKSTFLNAVKKFYNIKTPKLTTASQYQTTLDFIKIPIDENNYLIDTPGFINYHSYGAYLNDESMSRITPKNYLKPRTFQLHTSQAIFVGGLAEIDFLEGEKINASFYVSSEVVIHRTKLDNVDNLYPSRVVDLLSPPCSIEEFEKIKETKVVHFRINSGAYDVTIAGIGFVHIVGEKLHFTVKVHQNIDVMMVESFL